MKNPQIHSSGLDWRSLAAIGGLLAALALTVTSCTSGTAQSPDDQQAPVAVQAALPVRQLFHADVEAFGTLAGDSRRAQTLSLPQAGQVIAVAVTSGRRVRKGDTLLRVATDPNARSAYLQAVSALRVAQDDYARTQRLHDAKLATNAQLDTARKTLGDAQAALDAQAKLGGAQAETALAAPADGVVTAIGVKLGEHFSAGANLAEFTPQHALAAQLGVEPEQAARIALGMAATLAPVYGDAQALPGKVAAVAGAIDPQTHLVDVLVDFDAGADTTLAAGAALSARIDTAQFEAWAVPRSALLEDAQGHYLFQIEHGRARRVGVRVLSSEGDPVGVDGKLDPRAPVIALGAYELSDGDAVKAQSAKGAAE